MVRLLGCVLLFLCLPKQGAAQMPFYHYFEDSIRPGYRISGSFDSIDVKLGVYQSALPTTWRPTVEAFDVSRMSVSTPIQALPKRYSSIPHVGLQYAFGSNVSQQGGIAYTQAITPRQFIQFNYVRTSTAGAIRNAAIENNHVDLAHLVRKQRYASQLELLFDGSNRGTNGGFLNDTVDETIPLEFQSVEKSTAQITQRYFHVDWKNFISFTKDSLIKTGLYLAPHYQIENKRYTEQDDIDAVYGVVNIDSNETNDYWERSEIGGTAGYFFHTKHLSINGGLKSTYWDFDNLSRKSDTLEVGIVSDLIIDVKDALQLKASGTYTFIGANGEKSINSQLNYTHRFASLRINASFNQCYPTNVQRSYFSNVLNYSWQTKTLITTTKIAATIQSNSSKVPVDIGFSFQNTANNPFFIGDTWRQDTLTNLSFLNAFIRADLSWRKLFFQPLVRFQQSNFDFVPTFQASARLGFNGFLFKAKKLRATIGVDLGYCSSFSLLDYIPMVDAYTLPGNSASFKRYDAMPKIHFFTQFELGFFRWFIRVENIEQTFWTPTNQENLGYPVVPMQLRLGLSWDLFN